MARWPIGLTVLAVLAGAKMMMHPAVPQTPEGRARMLATTLDAGAPMPLGRFATMTGAKPDGNVIEFDIRLAADAPLNIPTDAFQRMFIAASCQQSSVVDFVHKGGAIRYAMITAEGRGLDPITVDRCPGA